MSKKYLAVSLFAASFMLAGGVALAATHDGAGVHNKSNALIATVTSISDSTITVTVKGENAAITTVNATGAKVKVNGTDGTISDIKAGDRIIALGTASGDTMVATQIIDGSKDAGGAGHTSGMVTGVVSSVNSDGSIVVTVADHTPGKAKGAGKKPGAAPSSTTQTVATDSSTHFFVPGVKDATISDVKDGDSVMLMSQGSGTAKMVTVRPEHSSKK